MHLLLSVIIPSYYCQLTANNDNYYVNVEKVFQKATSANNQEFDVPSYKDKLEVLWNDEFTYQSFSTCTDHVSPKITTGSGAFYEDVTTVS